MALRPHARLWLASAATVGIVAPLAWFWQDSLLPDAYDMGSMGEPDWGGGPRAAAGHAHHGAAVADLVADPDRRPDVRETFTVARDGDGYTVNGTSPGPVLEAEVGDLVEVRLVNEDVEEGTTLHWHGIDVPNAVDGVAGVTQDAVRAGEEHTYRFVAEQAGTFWYHSHQLSHEQVRQGLLGAVVIRPRRPDPGVAEHLALIHDYERGPTLNGRPGITTVDAEPGDRVRVRVVNTDNGLARVWVTGAPYEVLAVDGTEVIEPDKVSDRSVDVPAGGRVDLGVDVPEGGARVELGGATSLVLGEDPTGGDQATAPSGSVDLLTYGEPADLGLDPDDADRTFDYRIGKRPGFLDGRPGMWWTVNGKMFPDTPMYMVSEGDTVVFDIENASDDAHPMHLHGHHAVVLARDGEEATGSPWWVDSLEVRSGESFRVALVADNPGVWMDHCHNLPHAAEGLVAHLMYEGVSSSYRVGGEPGNEPE